MKRKLKKTMNKEEGFTLVELLAVIVILGIILAIAIPSVGTVVENARKDAKDAEYAMVVNAGRLYLTGNKGTEATDRTVTVGFLINQGYLEDRESENFKEDNVVIKDGNVYKLYDKATNRTQLYPKSDH